MIQLSSMFLYMCEGWEVQVCGGLNVLQKPLILLLSKSLRYVQTGWFYCVVEH